ncbi:unnamed protein product [Vitrella brassicaformis CCMP3155]|uniref:Uncharacterized protein n=1 Tax=Vitrella brassicaformis (strain CCMP3155) TaxID=1169540 RepID=A0A0G4ECR8_VITBC|nr:unnamed protein product [Vitrella brassicaformis CCMP3155]|eukprot:CEL93531.1 unnamed protein product [Vitrella brassicaformis CCMP3155]
MSSGSRRRSPLAGAGVTVDKLAEAVDAFIAAPDALARRGPLDLLSVYLTARGDHATIEQRQLVMALQQRQSDLLQVVHSHALLDCFIQCFQDATGHSVIAVGLAGNTTLVAGNTALVVLRRLVELGYRFSSTLPQVRQLVAAVDRLGGGCGLGRAEFGLLSALLREWGGVVHPIILSDHQMLIARAEEDGTRRADAVTFLVELFSSTGTPTLPASSWLRLFALA